MRATKAWFGLLAAATFGACADPGRTGEPALRRRVTFFHAADIHSHLFPRRLLVSSADAERGLGIEGEYAEVGGTARLAALLERERARAEASFFFDSGDVLEGSSVFALFQGVPEVLSLEALGTDAETVGNHDLGRGPEALAALRRGRTSFPLLAANLPGLLESGLAGASAVFERAGVRVGVVGLGREPEASEKPYANAAAVEDAIRRFEPPVDVVVALSHLGRESDLGLIPQTSGLDVVLGGHTHDVLDPPQTVMDCGPTVRASAGCTPKPVTVVHSGAYGRYLGRLDLTLSAEPTALGPLSRTRSAVVESRYQLLPVNDALPSRADVEDLLAPYRDAWAASGLDATVAYAPFAISRSKPMNGDSALGNFVTRALRTAGAADLALINSTGVRSDLPSGALTVDDFFEVLPFDDALVILEISGDDLRQAFDDIAGDSCRRNRVSQVEIDGVAATFGCSGAGSAGLEIGGNPISKGAKLRLSTASFVTDKGQWLAHRGTVVERGPPIRDVVIGAARRGPSCSGGGLASGLPCVDGALGALVDGRISWR